MRRRKQNNYPKQKRDQLLTDPVLFKHKVRHILPRNIVTAICYIA